MEDILTRIDTFLQEKNMPDVVFCKLCGASASWLQSIRRRGGATKIHPRIGKKLESVLNGSTIVPEQSYRRTIPQQRMERRLLRVGFPDDYNVTPLIKRISESGKNVTYKEFTDLCQADWTFHKIGIK